MELWRVLDYTSATLCVAVKHSPNNLLNSNKKVNLEPQQNVALVVEPLDESS